MRKIIFVLATLIANYVIHAQVKTPQPSPKADVHQVVGLTDVEIEYSYLVQKEEWFLEI